MSLFCSKHFAHYIVVWLLWLLDSVHVIFPLHFAILTIHRVLYMYMCFLVLRSVYHQIKFFGILGKRFKTALVIAYLQLLCLICQVFVSFMLLLHMKSILFCCLPNSIPWFCSTFITIWLLFFVLGWSDWSWWNTESYEFCGCTGSRQNGLVNYTCW